MSYSIPILCLLQVTPGARCAFHQEVVAIDSQAATCHFLGPLDQRAVVSPDLDVLLPDQCPENDTRLTIDDSAKDEGVLMDNE